MWRSVISPLATISEIRLRLLLASKPTIKSSSTLRIRWYPANKLTSYKLRSREIRDELRTRIAQFTEEMKPLEKERIEQRTSWDLEMIQEMGSCPGIENYSRHFTGRAPGEAPPTLIEYFPDEFLTFIDESHVTVPQIGGMYRGDRARKMTLVEHGFRLPSALDNRPLNFEEWEAIIRKTLYVSATPGEYELKKTGGEIVLSREPVWTMYTAQTLRGFWEHQLRWARTVRLCRPLSYLGLLVTQGLPWTILAALLAPAGWIASTYLAAYVVLRSGVAWTVGVWGVGDQVLRRNLWLVPARDAIYFVVWLASFGSNGLLAASG